MKVNRTTFLAYGFTFWILNMLVSDPDLGLVQNLPIGSFTITMISLLSWFFPVAILYHVTRKGLFDYYDTENMLKVARTSSEGAGKAVIGMAINNLAVAILIAAVIIAFLK